MENIKAKIKEVKKPFMAWIGITIAFYIISIIFYPYLNVDEKQMDNPIQNIPAWVIGLSLITTIVAYGAALFFPTYLGFLLYKKSARVEETLIIIGIGWLLNTIISLAGSVILHALQRNMVGIAMAIIGVIIGSVISLVINLVLGYIGYFIGSRRR